MADLTWEMLSTGIPSWVMMKTRALTVRSKLVTLSSRGEEKKLLDIADVAALLVEEELCEGRRETHALSCCYFYVFPSAGLTKTPPVFSGVPIVFRPFSLIFAHFHPFFRPFSPITSFHHGLFFHPLWNVHVSSLMINLS